MCESLRKNASVPSSGGGGEGAKEGREGCRDGSQIYGNGREGAAGTWEAKGPRGPEDPTQGDQAAKTNSTANLPDKLKLLDKPNSVGKR